MAEHFTLFKLVPRIYDELLRQVRNNLDSVRKMEKEIMLTAVKRGRMPRADFISTFPGNESNLNWLDDVTSSKKSKAWADSLKAVRDDIERAQRRVQQMEVEELQTTVGVFLRNRDHRISPRLQVLDLRHLVDSSGHYPVDC